MLQHPWPGNVRELLNTLRRLTLWSEETVISDKEVLEGLIVAEENPSRSAGILDQDISQGIDLKKTLDEVEASLIKKAWEYTGRRKQKTADLLGFKNWQNLNLRLKKYNLE